MAFGLGPAIRGQRAVAVAFLGLAQVMFNHFGFDRNGFRAIMLLPTPRRRILLGKNLALLPAAAGGLRASISPWRPCSRDWTAWNVLTACVEFVGAFLALSALGNRRLDPPAVSHCRGLVEADQDPGRTTRFLILLTRMLLLPLAMLPAFLPAWAGVGAARWTRLPGSVVALASAVLLAGVSAPALLATLGAAGRLLQRREQRILKW